VLQRNLAKGQRTEIIKKANPSPDFSYRSRSSVSPPSAVPKLVLALQIQPTSHSRSLYMCIFWELDAEINPEPLNRNLTPVQRCHGNELLADLIRIRELTAKTPVKMARIAKSAAMDRRTERARCMYLTRVWNYFIRIRKGKSHFKNFIATLKPFMKETHNLPFSIILFYSWLQVPKVSHLYIFHKNQSLISNVNNELKACWWTIHLNS